MPSTIREAVTTKVGMYRRIVAGEFGNTLPRFFRYGDWTENRATGYASAELWGVQHTTIPGFQGTRLDVHRDDVGRLVENVFHCKNYCISPMIHQFGKPRFEGDVTRLLGTGLVVCGNIDPAPGTWRKHMLKPREWRGSAARVLLDHLLNANSRDDLEVLLDEFPDHVVELTALSCEFGTCPGRNAVVWEVRRY